MWSGLPKLVRFYIRHVLIGFAVALAFTAALLALDVGSLRGLIFGTSGGYIALAMLTFANGLVFGGVQFAIAIMGLAEDGGPRGGTALPLWRWATGRRHPAPPVPVRAED